MVLSASQTDRQNYTQLLQLACQGNEHAIATLMNRHLKQQQLTAHVTWEGTCLHILLEAAQILSPEPLASVIHKTVLKIQVEKLRSLKVSFRQSGEHQCVWSQQRTIPHPTPHTPHPDLPVDRAPPTPAPPFLSQTGLTRAPRQTWNSVILLPALIRKRKYAFCGFPLALQKRRCCP